jgi:nitroimidazol reductase NimA-like FMN-containing flavoprotein (pyridoxamine 5'-phosphate oxidase superfamily)
MESVGREEALEILASQPVAHLGIVIDGQPYVTPMSFVMDGERLLFRTMAGMKLDGIRANPAVCIETAEYNPDTGDWVSVIVRGTARLVDDPETRQGIVARLFEKYEKVMASPLSGGGGLTPLGGTPYVIVVRIDDITGMSSGRGMRVRTKPGRM